MRKGTGRPRMDGDVEQEIRRLALMNWTAAQIFRELGKREDFKGRLPQERTMRRAVRWYRPDDTSGWWSVADDDTDPEDAELVLPVLAAAIEWSKGTVARFSKGEARWIVKVRKAAPDIPPVWAFQVAFSYWWQKCRDEPTENLDQMLAYAPWRGKSHLHRYLQATRYFHPDWFAPFGVDATVPLIQLLHAVSSKPASLGLIVALGCWELNGKGTFNDQTR